MRFNANRWRVAKINSAVSAFGDFLPYLATELKRITTCDLFEVSYLEVISYLADLYCFFNGKTLPQNDFNIRPAFDTPVEEQFVFFGMGDALFEGQCDNGTDELEPVPFKGIGAENGVLAFLQKKIDNVLDGAGLLAGLIDDVYLSYSLTAGWYAKFEAFIDAFCSFRRIVLGVDDCSDSTVLVSPLHLAFVGNGVAEYYSTRRGAEIWQRTEHAYDFLHVWTELRCKSELTRMELVHVLEDGARHCSDPRMAILAKVARRLPDNNDIASRFVKLAAPVMESIRQTHVSDNLEDAVLERVLQDMTEQLIARLPDK